MLQTNEQDFSDWHILDNRPLYLTQKIIFYQLLLITIIFIFTVVVFSISIDFILTGIIAILVLVLITLLSLTRLVIKSKRFFSNVYCKDFNISYKVSKKRMEQYLINNKINHIKFSEDEKKKNLPGKFFAYYYLNLDNIYIGLPLFIDVKQTCVTIGPITSSSKITIKKYQNIIDTILKTE